jgi:hypothetical protein
MPASASIRKPMICSSEKRFFMSVSCYENGLYKDQAGMEIGGQFSERKMNQKIIDIFEFMKVMCK